MTQPVNRPGTIGKHRRRIPWLAILIGVCVVLAAVSLYAWGRAEGQRRFEAQITNRELADPILELCTQGGEIARALATEGKCALAEQARDFEEPEPLPSGVNREQVAQLVQEEVAKLTLPPGQGPTSGQLQEAAESVILAHPELFQGEAGGPPSDAQVAAAVNAWFQANPPPQGPEGDEGPQGDEGPRGPAPAGWIARYPSGATESCVRSGGSESEPFYECEFTPASGIDPEPVDTTPNSEPVPAEPGPTPEPDPLIDILLG